MTWTVQSTDLRRRVREVLERVRIGHETVIIRSYDQPQAVIIPYEEFQEYRAWQDHRQERTAWLNELRRIAAEVSARAALQEDDANTLIAEAIQEVRQP